MVLRYVLQRFLLMNSIMTQLTALEFCRRNVIVTLTLGLNSEVLANKH